MTDNLIKVAEHHTSCLIDQGLRILEIDMGKRMRADKKIKAEKVDSPWSMIKIIDLHPELFKDNSLSVGGLVKANGQVLKEKSLFFLEDVAYEEGHSRLARDTQPPGGMIVHKDVTNMIFLPRERRRYEGVGATRKERPICDRDNKKVIMSNNRLFENVTLRFWYGGRFKHVVGKEELVYMGGMGRTFQVAPDELCYWELVHFGKKCGDYSDIAGLYFLVPNLSLADGLRKITEDAEVLEMGEIVMKHRSVDVYVLHSREEPHLSPENPSPSDSHSSPSISENIPPPIPTKPKKLTPKKGPESQHLGPPRRSPRKYMESNVTASTSLPGPPLTKKVGSTASTLPHAYNNSLTQPSTTSKAISNLESAHDTVNQNQSNPSVTTEYEWEDNRSDRIGEDDDVDLKVEDDGYFEVDEGLDRFDLFTASSASVQHHSTTAQPTHLGRSGRVIYSGRGARGAARGGTRGGAANAGPSVRGTRGGRGRGRGRGQVPSGVGVLFNADGAPILQGPYTKNRARDQEPHISTQSSQTSTVHQQQP
uniref:PB1-like domain-containing protein n=1 Tax=Chenopodium quinoa TaxID=63459 RepID=A0A803MGQ6_CHEQI